MSKVKAAPAPSAKGKFDASAWAKNGVPEDEINNIKTAFDLFDTDQGGSIDIKGTCCSR
jgi:Ca2+-binding EF-hand superfamily protein